MLNTFVKPFLFRAPVFTSGILVIPMALAQQEETKQLEPVVVSASRTEQRLFDAPAAINAVPVDAFRAGSPLVNMSELLSAVPGVQVRERQNYAQDLQISVRGFGTRSTFGVRGVRILIDGIPATMPDGQGQASTASLTSAKRIEVLRGPLAQLYGNAAGGVLQVFTKDPPVSSRPQFGLLAGFGSDDQRHYGVSVGGGSETLGALLDLSRYSTDGYRDHSAAERTQFNAKLVAKPSADTTVTGVVNSFDQPVAEDPLGLTRSAFKQNPRQVIPAAIAFNTRKTIEQHQAGLVVEHRMTAADTLNARVYGGTRKVNQKLAFETNGVVDLDRDYGGIGASWTRKTRVNGQPLQWTVGMEADKMWETRRGFDNIAGGSGALRRNEDDTASNTDLFGQASWMFAPRWEAIGGVRFSRVRFTVDDNFNAPGANTSGSVKYRNTSPVVGLVFHASDSLNIYGNIGKGFETPTLAETAYRPGPTGAVPGPNFLLQPSRSVQAELGMKMRSGRHTLDAALFNARSKDEIVSQSGGGRATFFNVDRVQRRGAELSWSADWRPFVTRLGYTFLDARFKTDFTNQQGSVESGNRLPGAPAHSLFADVEARATEAVKLGLEMRVDSKVYVNDANTEAAPGYAVFNARAGYEFAGGPAKWLLFARIDNLLDKQYAGSVIVNEANRRFYEPAPGRRFFVGLRTMF